MPFPTPQNAADTTGGIKVNDDFKLKGFGRSLDELLGELNIQKQTFEAPAPPPGSAAPTASEPGAPQPVPGQFDFEPAPITREEAERAGERAAILADSVLSVAGMIIAKEDSPEKYKASEGELKDLSKAWSDVSEQYSFKINSWVNIALLSLMVYGPKIMQAANDRKIKNLQEEQARQAEIQAEQARQLKELQEKMNKEGK